ncbi:MAG: hypothetical protein B0D92_03930 [Spirochaeta sp. LUC14_002_19_P3]|nr:MAG: hypothetical protein B0D92_03930 [Spirochaeta sp. LUC14_002_19_P3]
MSERITENIVRDKFRPFHNNGFIIEEQKSSNPKISKLLQSASKAGDGKGYPEFIIQSEEDADFLMTVECKAQTQFHQSPGLDKYKDYAVDGALLYSSYLSKEFDVISLGVSGQSEEELLATSFLQLKTSKAPSPFADKLLTLPEFKEKYVHREDTRHQRYERLLDYNKNLNQTLHSYKIPEANRSLLLSGILIALSHNVFKDGYTKYQTAKQLAASLVNAVVDQLSQAEIPNVNVETLKHAYSFIKTNATLSNDKQKFINLISEVDDRVNSFVKTYRFYDIFGDFYIEFLRYANSDKGLGIVLTPKHITELFCDIAGLTKDSVVFDNCCGTGGFLISSMREMMKLADHDKTKESEIKKNQVIGIEYQDSIFPLACSNMIVNGDGKTNLFHDDCFNTKFNTGLKIRAERNGKVTDVDEEVRITEHIKRTFAPSIGLLNPPYKTDKEDKEELEFVLNNLEGLAQNALCVAIIPMSCVLAQKGKGLELKRRILKHHTLEAVVSLPNELFHNSKVSVVTCGVVIKAHIPHPEGYKTFFGYWKDDGFVKRKQKGRIDGGLWSDIKEKWLRSYRNKDSLPGLSVVQFVSAKDEWCAEAYMETDYSTLTEEDFIKTIKSFVAFQFLNEDRLYEKS